MHRLDLLRMNAKLAAETEPPAAPRISSHRIGIGNGRRHAIHRRINASQPRRKHDLRAKQMQLLAIPIDAEIDLKIQRTEHDP